MSSQQTRYTRLAIILHWLIALGIFVAFPLGLYMHELPLSPRKLQLYSYHKWIGITLLALMLARLGWRLWHTPPAMLPMPQWQKQIAESVHVGLYVLLFAVPLSGWLMSSALGFQVVWLGLVPLPDLVHKNKELGELLKQVHKTLDFALLGLLILHIAGALKHQWIDRDGTLQRMLLRIRRNEA